MHRLGTAAARRIKYRVDVQIAFSDRRWPDRPRFVGECDMERGTVGLRVNGDRRDPEPPRGADHAAGDFAAIGDQDLAEQAHIRNTPKRVPSIGALRLAEIASARVNLVSTGSMTPSSHNRALA